MVRHGGSQHDEFEHQHASELPESPHAGGEAEVELLAGLVEDAPDALLVVDTQGLIRRVNRQTESLFGYPREQLLGQSVELLVPERLRSRHLRHRDAYVATLLRRRMGEGKPFLGRRRDGTEIPVEVSLAPLTLPSGQAFTAAVRDATTRVKLESELVRMALHDPLTGLPNRTLVLDRLRNALARQRRQGTSVALLFVDIDQLKMVNDGLGHDAGDSLIRATGRRMAEVLRPSDTVARVGGDEFIVLIEAVAGPSEAMALADRLRTVVRAPVIVGDRELRPTVSIGVAVSSESSEASSDDAMVQEADDAMYRAKRNGRDCAELFRQEWRADVLRALDLTSALARDVERGAIALHYQPVVDLHSGAVWGSEALLRWSAAQGEPVPAQEVVQIAGKGRLGVALDRAVLACACRDMASLAKNDGLLVGVNVSGRNVFTEDLPAMISRSLEDVGVSPSTLWIEVTEGEHLLFDPKAVEVMGRLRRLGVRIAIDDFGTGFSSLSRLRDLPLDILKIDKSFIAQIDADQRSQALVGAVITLAHSLGLQAVAEGVERGTQLEILRELGCDYGQGFFWTPALEARDFERYCRRHHTAGTYAPGSSQSASGIVLSQRPEK